MALHLSGTVLPGGVHRDVFVRDGRITFDEQADADTVLADGYLLPGLVDAHAHLALYSPAGDQAPPDVRVKASGRAQLDAGVLALREPGSPDYSSVGLGPADGMPRVVAGGRFLAPPGGYIPGLAREVAEDELPEAAAAEVRASGAWAKVIGDFPGPGGQLRAHWRADTLVEAARRVHDAGGRITIHAALPEVIEAAVLAGFDAVEHGTMLTEDHIRAMVERSVALVPTLLIRDDILGLLRGIGASESVVEQFRRVLDGQPEMVRRAAEAGVTVLAGTDAGMVPHGGIATEMRQLLDAGLPQEAALGAASWTARAYLGLPGIEEAAPADIVGYPDDPRGDPEVLRRPSVVILDGRLIRPDRAARR